MANPQPNDPSLWRASTTSNPYVQGGWTPSTERSPREYLTAAPPAFATETQSSYGALPLAISPIDAASSSTDAHNARIRFVPRPQKSGLKINCAVLDHHDHVHYNVITESAGLTMVKDFERHSVALIDWATTVPMVDIRGGKGKIPVDQWLLRDSNHPWVLLHGDCSVKLTAKYFRRTRLMQWKDAWYSWITDPEHQELRVREAHSDLH